MTGFSRATWVLPLALALAVPATTTTTAAAAAITASLPSHKTLNFRTATRRHRVRHGATTGRPHGPRIPSPPGPPPPHTSWTRSYQFLPVGFVPATKRSYPFLPVGFVAGPALTAITSSAGAGSAVAETKGRRERSRACINAVRSSGGREAGAWWGGARSGRRQRPWGGGAGEGRSSLVVVGAGSGETEYYSWTETDEDVEVRVPLPPGTAAKSVQLSVTKFSLTLGLKGREGPVLKGSLKGPVHADMSHWTMEEMEDTGVKMLYLCLSKSLDMEALEQNNLPGEWVGVLEGEDALNIYYPDKDKDFDVDEYVKKMGYDRERDIDKVDKTMFSDLTAEMRDNLKTTLPQTPFSDEDDMIPVAAGPKVSPTIDTGVLGVHMTPSFETEHVTDETVIGEQDAFVESSSTAVAAQAEVVTEDDVDASWAAKFATDSGTGGGAAGARSASVEGGVAQSTGELTAKQREISAGLRETYDKLVKSGMLQVGVNPDGTPEEMPDMDEMARSYDAEKFMFKDGDFSEEELSKYAASVMSADSDGAPGSGIDIDDADVRAAFGLD